jgi:phosphoribosylformylglycinamidine synthase subunit PurS
MNFKAEIDIMPHEALLDPQGKAVTAGLAKLGMSELTNVRIGKHITMMVEAADKAEAEKKIDEACKKLLVNQVMESYSFKLSELVA